MNLTDTRPAGAPAAPLPPSTAKAVLPRRRRPGLIAAGVVIVVLGFLGAYWFATTAAASKQYLAVATTITAGQRITDADLKVVQINPGGLTPIPAAQRASVVDRYAKVELVAGTLLINDQLTDNGFPGPGKQLIGLELKPAQLPARDLRPGEPVLIIITSDTRIQPGGPDGKNAAQDLPNPPTIKAVVAGVGAPGAAGQVVVDVEVNATDGPGVLDRASQGRVALALVAR